ncbi:MAG: hypothetical protein HN778_18090 [Prolixibacteraceae bacterium]|jgi:hypothetical protein|nr:hypothetical protein [Prolixibacteraceae bacterium]MBT6006908.1 hypothetical protein [Prolixibacteraceae bacterium]MBT6766015.1 hypothetical protein [Prolixibacteraceae bacterium]MBT6998407.1 hypothetical protein [Prolixibacteraceae bacterium]MBT7396744.1 hypothetical protein [Prolixibacteraceae bacterium]
MKQIIVIVIAAFILAGGNLNAQNYDSVSGATQKADGKNMTFEQFSEALKLESKTVFSTVNADGTPNVAVYIHVESLGDNIIAAGSMADTKTTKINILERKQAVMLLILPDKTEDGFDGAKVVLKYIDDKEKIADLRSKMEESTEKTTFFTVEKFLNYR